MKINVHLYGVFLKRYPQFSSETETWVDIKKGASVNELIKMLGVDLTAIGMVAVNGKLTSLNTILYENSNVKIFHPIAGG